MSINIKTAISVVFIVGTLLWIRYSAKYQIDNNTRDITTLEKRQTTTDANIKELPIEVGKIIDQKLDAFGNQLILKLDDRYKKKTE